MHKTFGEAKEYMHVLTANLPVHLSCRVLLAPSFPLIFPMAEWAKESLVEIGAQNVHDQEKGAFTGEVAVSLVKEAGASFVLLGHSERRHLFHEEGAFIARKVKSVLAHQIQPILCIGETLEERERGLTKEVLQKQLLEGLEGLSSQELLKMVLAYEPVWAIGTGKNATAEQAQEVHVFCRSILEQGWGSDVAFRVPILYGGSVKGDNMAELISQKDIDGVLVGGASLDPSSFLQIIQHT